MPAFSRPAEIALRRGRHNRLGFAYQVPFVRVLGRWKNVILYGEIKIDRGKLKMRDPYRVFLHESGQYPMNAYNALCALTLIPSRRGGTL